MGVWVWLTQWCIYGWVGMVDTMVHLVWLTQWCINRCVGMVDIMEQKWVGG